MVCFIEERGLICLAYKGREAENLFHDPDTDVLCITGPPTAGRGLLALLRKSNGKSEFQQYAIYFMPEKGPAVAKILFIFSKGDRARIAAKKFFNKLLRYNLPNFSEFPIHFVDE